MNSDIDASRHLSAAVSAALAAGREILDVYQSDFDISAKADRSPLTIADIRAHNAIHRAMAPVKLPLLSEEGRHLPYSQRRRWNQLWIVDPLDGTKEFVSRNGEFTVNIALVENRRAVLGVIYVPCQDRLYLGLRDAGAWCVPDAARSLAGGTALRRWRDKAEVLPYLRVHGEPFTVVGSRSHANPALDQFVSRLHRTLDPLAVRTAGSALKFCRIAEGRADVYPRPAPTMEWDTAAGQCIVEAVGGRVLVWGTDLPLEYNREDLVNPGFLAFGPGLDHEIMLKMMDVEKGSWSRATL